MRSSTHEKQTGMSTPGFMHLDSSGTGMRQTSSRFWRKCTEYGVHLKAKKGVWNAKWPAVSQNLA